MRRSATLLALVVALLLGAAVPAWGAVTSATIEVLNAQMSYLPFYPPQFLTVGVVTIKTDQPIYVAAGKCTANNICPEKTIVPCCAVRLALPLRPSSFSLSNSVAFYRGCLTARASFRRDILFLSTPHPRDKLSSRCRDPS